MFKKDNLETPPDKVNTVIGKDTYFKGTLSGKGLIRIDGEAEGTITNKGDVIIGETGQVVVELKARNITIAGRYEGNLEAEGRLELKRTATAIGTFKTNGLLIEEGAILSGTTEMKLKEEVGTDKSTAVKRDWNYKPVEAEAGGKSQKFSSLAESITPDKSYQ